MGYIPTMQELSCSRPLLDGMTPPLSNLHACRMNIETC